MRKFVTCLAVFALVLSVGCGGDTADDACSAGCGAGCGPAKTTTKNMDDADKTVKDAADDVAKTVKDAADGVADAAKDISYKCKCGAEKTLAADAPAPS